MTGKLFFSVTHHIPKHTSAVINLGNGKKLIFQDTRKFGRIYLYNDLTPINERHGPEPLGKNFSVGWLHRALQQRKRNIKALLLDQSFLAGLGNIYVDESLWAAGIHPSSISNTLPAESIRRLHGAVQNILKAAIAARGTTIIDFSYLTYIFHFWTSLFSFISLTSSSFFGTHFSTSSMFFWISHINLFSFIVFLIDLRFWI